MAEAEAAPLPVLGAIASNGHAVVSTATDGGGDECDGNNDGSDSASSSLNEDNFASFFAALAASEPDDDGDPGDIPSDDGSDGNRVSDARRATDHSRRQRRSQAQQKQQRQLQQQQPSAEQRAIAWQEMLAAQDPYKRDQQLAEFSHEVVEVAGIRVKVRHYSGAQHRDKGTGRVVWPIAKRLAAFLAEMSVAGAPDPDFDLRGKAVLELGSGPGFLSVFARRLGARYVTMTDQAQLLPLMRMNCADNGLGAAEDAVDDGKQEHQERPGIRVAALDWGEASRSVFAPPHPQPQSQHQQQHQPPRGADAPAGAAGAGHCAGDTRDGDFDVVLCSDLIYSGYNRDPCTPLACTIARYVAALRTPHAAVAAVPTSEPTARAAPAAVATAAAAPAAAVAAAAPSKHVKQTVVVFAFRERGMLRLGPGGDGRVPLFFRQLRDVHGIASRQLQLPGRFGDDAEGYRLFKMWRERDVGARDNGRQQQRQVGEREGGQGCDGAESGGGGPGADAEGGGGGADGGKAHTLVAKEAPAVRKAQN